MVDIMWRYWGTSHLWWRTAQAMACNSQLGTRWKITWKLKGLPKKPPRTSEIAPEPQWTCTSITLFLWSQHTPAAFSASKPTCRTTSPVSPQGHGGAAGGQWHWMGFAGSHWNLLSKQLWQIRLAVQWLLWKVMQMHEWVTAPLGRKSYFRPAGVTAIAEYCQVDNQ